MLGSHFRWINAWPWNLTPKVFESMFSNVFPRIWNRPFRWDEIVKVCFKDGGIYSSDILFIELRDREKPAIVPTEARGGSEFFGELCGRGLFPLEVMRSAIRETSSGMHCWPKK